jgi:hypothetical protein
MGSPAVFNTLIGSNIVLTARQVSIDNLGGLALDLAAANFFVADLTDDIAALSVLNVPAADFQLASLQIAFVADGTPRTIAWPAGTLWAGGAAPTPSSGAGEIDIFQLESYDRGASWFGFTLGQAFA